MSLPVKLKRAKSAYQIFLIDDEELVLEVYRSILLDAGYRNLHSFTSASDALNMLRCLRPDLIITDIHMPDVDGNVLTRLVREFEHLDEIPVIAITSDSTTETANAVFENGADAVLIKPVAQEELVTQVTNARERAAAVLTEGLPSCR